MGNIGTGQGTSYPTSLDTQTAKEVDFGSAGANATIANLAAQFYYGVVNGSINITNGLIVETETRYTGSNASTVTAPALYYQTKISAISVDLTSLTVTGSLTGGIGNGSRFRLWRRI
jgi:hypothetical protein